MSTLARYLNPDVIQQVSRLDLRARFIVEGFVAGLHRSPYSGLSVEFSEHRKYVQGDEPRSIDWKVFARSDRLFVRKYEAETHLACHILVDASASMGAVGFTDTQAETTADNGGLSAKMSYAIHLAAALGYLVVRQQDAVGLGVIGAGLETLLPARSRQADLVELLATLARVEPHGTTGLARGVHEALARIPHRGLVVLISDLLTDTAELTDLLHHVRFRGHDLIVMHLLDAAEAHFDFDGGLRLEDPESEASLVADAPAVRMRYLAELQRWRDELDRQVAMLRGDYVALDTSMSFDKALVEFLLQRQRRR